MISRPFRNEFSMVVQCIGVLAVLAALFVPSMSLGAPLAPPGPPPEWTAHNPIVVLTPPAGLAPFVISGLHPAQIRKAYGIDLLGSNGEGKTIAIVVAFGNPNMAEDLAIFNAQFGLASANLTVVYPGGVPPISNGWALETALDVEWAHAIAPAANILLVAALSNSGTDMLAAVDYATANGADVVSMSGGAPSGLPRPLTPIRTSTTLVSPTWPRRVTTAPASCGLRYRPM